MKNKTILIVISTAFLMGIVFFSGSIYFLATNELTHLKTKFLGPFTPIGGLFLISAWGYLFYSILCKKPTI